MKAARGEVEKAIDRNHAAVLPVIVLARTRRFGQVGRSDIPPAVEQTICRATTYYANHSSDIARNLRWESHRHDQSKAATGYSALPGTGSVDICV
jgi:hypothetical protein